MASCGFCGESLAPGVTLCPVCGFPIDPAASPYPSSFAGQHADPVRVPAYAVSTDWRVCSSCGKTYGPEYGDPFCVCGFELVQADPPAAPVARLTPERPPPGTRCLVLYGLDKRPLCYFGLNRDVTLIGRLDAVAGNFPDIDVSEWLDAETARKVSRKHAMILRTRTSDTYTLRALAGNTGTQVEADMIPALQDIVLEPGRRLILGGAVRFKFEIA